jgi:hypothetical protein
MFKRLFGKKENSKTENSNIKVQLEKAQKIRK